MLERCNACVAAVVGSPNALECPLLAALSDAAAAAKAKEKAASLLLQRYTALWEAAAAAGPTYTPQHTPDQLRVILEL